MKKTKPVITLKKLQEICSQNLFEIVSNFFMLKDDKGIKIRFLDFYGDFGYTTYGHFFFIEDCMYLISDDEKYSEDHNPDIIDMDKDLGILRLIGGYIVRVIFAGFLTGFKDDEGKPIYTGDVIETSIRTNPDFPSTGGMYRAQMKDEPRKSSRDRSNMFAGIAVYQNDYQIVMDNISCPLSWARTIKIIGNVFYDISFGDTEINIFSTCASIAQSRDRKAIYSKITNAPTITND